MPRRPGTGGSDVGDEVGALLGTLQGDEPGGDGSSIVGTIASLLLGDCRGGGRLARPLGDACAQGPWSAPYDPALVDLVSRAAHLPATAVPGRTSVTSRRWVPPAARCP